jgi:magnesium-transporting ATPase (P-type)
MFGISKKETVLLSDKDLKQKERYDNYLFVKILKWAIVLVSIVVFIFFVLCLLFDKYSLQSFVIGIVKENFVAIIFYCLSIFGLTRLNKQ